MVVTYLFDLLHLVVSLAQRLRRRVILARDLVDLLEAVRCDDIVLAARPQADDLTRDATVMDRAQDVVEGMISVREKHDRASILAMTRCEYVNF